MGNITSRKEKCSICGQQATIQFGLYGHKKQPMNMLESIPAETKLCGPCLEDDYELEVKKQEQKK